MFVPFIYWHPLGRIGCQEIDTARKDERMRPERRDFHELLYRDVNPGLIDSPMLVTTLL